MTITAKEIINAFSSNLLNIFPIFLINIVTSLASFSQKTTTDGRQCRLAMQAGIEIPSVEIDEY